MYKDYNMTQLTLPMETSVLIPTNDMSRHVLILIYFCLHDQLKLV
ncbi:hypothetical protein ACUXOR_002134 [Staphylococcus pasteuri]|uniref:Transposase n=1 Tax=Staphylococcus pasteuri TaxID=45972 RepID=A0ABY1H480_9STAP|nr:hypothetical protein SAMN03097721_02114 [Staphylococcus pasteuri]